MGVFSRKSSFSDLSVVVSPDEVVGALMSVDSGDEDLVSLQNLPGSQLRAAAEVQYGNSCGDWESDDDLSLAEVNKRRRLNFENECASTSQASLLQGQIDNSVSPAVPVPSISTNAPTMINFKNNKYTWSSRDTQPTLSDWHNPQRPDQYGDKNPIEYFDCMFDDVVLNILVIFTNLYATKKNKEVVVLQLFYGMDNSEHLKKKCKESRSRNVIPSSSKRLPSDSQIEEWLIHEGSSGSEAEDICENYVPEQSDHIWETEESASDNEERKIHQVMSRETIQKNQPS
ncbi:unnamed protein product [Parnassius apollo]|uniref:(apollo) hypothetical protein n=1 Tax=Parnassius apollo TaxID=110799 RepID=A0A8S3X4Z7_PARAO|nr:unnamed protein product [Parnassius apollo]